MVALFLDGAEGIAASPEELVSAVGFGVDRVFDQLVRQACREVGIPAEAFSEALDKDEALQARVQARLGELFSAEAIDAARAKTALREAARQLHILRYALSGQEPSAWVWDEMDRQERARLRAFREAGGDEDDALLAKVTKALARLEAGEDGGYGRCDACEGPISAERLALLPYAERCTQCQRTADGEAPGDGSSHPKVSVRMFFEGGKPVPKDQQLR